MKPRTAPYLHVSFQKEPHMLGFQDLAMFIVAGLLLNMTPGADTLYIVGRSAAQGIRAGAVAALGIGAGCLVHTLGASLGLSALLASSAIGFTVVKLVGAAYLFYFGISILFARPSASGSTQALPLASLRKVFWGGFLTNALNPKVALFFLAFLPQFISPETNNKAVGMLFLGFVFVFNGTLWNLFIAWSSAYASKQFRSSPALVLWLRRLCGSMFLYFGVKLAWSES